MLLDWIKQRLWQSEVVDIVTRLSPMGLASKGGRPVRKLGEKVLYNLYKPLFEKSFSVGDTPEQVALKIVANRINDSISRLSGDEKSLLGQELRGKQPNSTHPLAQQIWHITDAALAWKSILKIQQENIDDFTSTVLQNVP